MGHAMIVCHLPDGQVVDIGLSEEKFFEIGVDIAMLQKLIETGEEEDTGYVVIDINVDCVSGPKEIPEGMTWKEHFEEVRGD